MNAISIAEAKQQWQSVADAIPLLLCLVDSEARIVRSNRTLERWHLGEVTAIRGRSLHDTLHPGCTAPDCPLHEFLHEALVGLAERRRMHMEGYDPQLRRHLAINVQPLIDDDGGGQMAGVQAVVSIDDVSEMRRSEHGVLCLHSSLRQCIGQEIARRQEAEEVQARLLNLISRTPNFIAITDAEGRLFYLNPAGRAMLGLGDEDMAQLSLADCLAPEARRALTEEVIPAALRQGAWRGPSTLLADDGRRIPTTQVVIANWNADGKPTGFSIVEQDMTAWVESEAALRRSQDELQRLSSELLDVQERERRRIADDLHDVIGQSLSLIKLSIEHAGQLIERGEAEAAGDALKGLANKAKDALVEVRRVSMDLRPSTLDDLGILATLSWFFREFEATCGHIRVEKAFAVKEEHIPRPLKTTIFRILQEATANIVKHAGADRMRVGLSHLGDMLELSVEDNGQGFDPKLSNGRSDRHGLGLRSMRERTRLSGGSYSVESAIGQGTRILARWPAAALSGE
jgi:PAS domain S-box-containing protein